MRRVHTIHALRPLVSGGSLSVLVMLLALYGIGQKVWVARVFENAPSDVFELSRFFVYAFSHTDLVVQVLAVVMLVSVIYLARETAKFISAELIAVRA